MTTQYRRVRQQPQLSLNLVGEYMSSSFVRRRSILRQAKFPEPYIGPRYEPARKAAALYLASGGDRDQLVSDLEAMLTGSERSRWFEQRSLLCRQAIDCILRLEAALKLDPLDVAFGGDIKHRMEIAGVTVTVVPDLIVRGSNRKGPFVGAIKFRYVKDSCVSESWTKYSTTLLHQFVEEQLSDEDRMADRRHCRFVDVFAGRIYEAPENFAKLRDEITAACEQIRDLWRSVSVD
jgi:hypothetical protein